MNTSASAFDAFSGMASATLYLVVGIAAVIASRDTRARVFLVIAISSVMPYAVPALIWLRGGRVALRPDVIVGSSVSLAVGSLALVHFMQIFPARRPWIRAHGPWLIAGYVAIPALAAIAATSAVPLLGMLPEASTVDAGAIRDVTIGPIQSLVMLLLLVPAVFVVGVALPFCGLLSLYKSWQEAKRDGHEGARVTTFWILVSQLAGGVLTILIVPLLHLVAPEGPWITITAGLLFGFGLLMPIAFAIGVWKYRLLQFTGGPEERR
jgi:hypothetical protein